MFSIADVPDHLAQQFHILDTTERVLSFVAYYFNELCVLRVLCGEHLIPLIAGLWRYGDYPDCVGLCQFGCAFTMALTRRAVEFAAAEFSSPQRSFDPASAGLVEVWGFEPQTFSLRTRRSTN